MLAVQTIKFKNDSNGNPRTIFAVYKGSKQGDWCSVRYYDSRGFGEKQAAESLGIKDPYILPTIYHWQPFSKYNIKDILL